MLEYDEQYDYLCASDGLTHEQMYTGNETLCRNCHGKWIMKGYGAAFTYKDEEYIFCDNDCCDQYVEDNQLQGIV